MYKIDEIIDFVKNESASKTILADSDIERDLGCTGDDFPELMDRYSKKYNVEMSDYLWYFHHAEEGNSFGSNFFRAPNEIVNHIPVTPKLLLEFAEIGKWNLKYPEHKLPKRRYDLIANQIFVLLVIICFSLYYFLK